MSYDSDVALATSGRGEADWDKIITLCNRIRNSFGASSMQFALESVMRRLKNTDPNVQLHTLTLLEACVSNCGSEFQIELTKSFFQSEIKALLATHPDPKVSQRLRELLGSWVTEFRSSSQMKPLLTFVEQLRNEGYSFAAAQQQLVQPVAHPVDTSSSTISKEESDLQKAIKMSLEEAKKPSTSSSSATLSSLYPVLTPAAPQKKQQPQQTKKVRALYDFQAAEDNELSFRAGEIITILDDSDENWWKGETHLGKGLFPANFVSLNLNSEPEQVKVEKENKKKEEPKKVMANEEKVELLLQMLSTADATIESSSENETIIELEKECQAMKPSIEEAIANLQKQEDNMKFVSEKFQEAMAYYRKLLAEGPRLSTMMGLQSQKVTTAQQFHPPQQQYQGQYQAPPQASSQQYQGPFQQYQPALTVQPSPALSGGSPYQTPAVGGYSSGTKMALPISSTPFLGEMTSIGGPPPPQYTPYASLPPSSGYQPSLVNQQIMTGSSSASQHPMMGLNQPGVSQPLNPTLPPVAQSLVMGIPPLSQQTMAGQLSGPSSFNLSSLPGGMQPAYSLYQVPPTMHQQPHPSLLH